MRRKKMQLHALVLPETLERLKEMVKVADRTYIGTTHSLGGIIDILVNDIKNPIERQRQKVKELSKKFYLEKQVLEDMEAASEGKQLEKKAKDLTGEQVIA